MRIKIRPGLSAAIMAALFSVPGFAQNRQTSDAIFTEARGSGAEQLMYTIGDIVAFAVVKPKLPGATAITEADQKILSASNSSLPDSEKLKAIQDAEIEKAQARLAALGTLEERKLIPNVIKSARVVGTTLVIVDVFERAWVWTALKANPTWSPVYTQLVKLGRGLATENALPPQ